MTKFKKFEATPSVVISGESTRTFVEAVTAVAESRMEILKKYGISDPRTGQWYPLQNWLDAMKEIETQKTNLKLIGQAMVKHAILPPKDKINSLHEMFSVLNLAFKMNYKGGDNGFYNMISFDDKKEKKIVMHVNTPYPLEFDKGILIGFWRAYKPKDAVGDVMCEYREEENHWVYVLRW